MTLTSCSSISDTDWITGFGDFDPDGGSAQPAYGRTFLLNLNFPGDATRDLLVNFNDLVALAQHYGLTTGARWEDGDFNNDAAVSFADLVILAQHYNTALSVGESEQLPLAFAGDWALATSLVPEPTCEAAACYAASLLGRRYRCNAKNP